jgi:hypothetical protein
MAAIPSFAYGTTETCLTYHDSKAHGEHCPTTFPIVIILSISIWQDEETQITTQSHGAAELLYKGKFVDERIPAIQRI